MSSGSNNFKVECLIFNLSQVRYIKAEIFYKLFPYKKTKL